MRNVICCVIVVLFVLAVYFPVGSECLPYSQSEANWMWNSRLVINGMLKYRMKGF